MDPVTEEYDIDLNKPAHEAWSDVLNNEAHIASELYQEAWEDFELNLGSVIPEFSSWILGYQRMNKDSDSYVTDEMQLWADATNLPLSRVVALNASYSIAAWGSWYQLQSPTYFTLPKVVGCTAGATFLKGTGMVHYRNMDWELEEIRNATRIFNMHKNGHTVRSVGIAGYSGVLSAMVDGEYSVTLNFAPPTDEEPLIGGSHSAPMFLRKCVLDSATRDAALNNLSERQMSTGALYLLCGSRKKHGAVRIERTPKQAYVSTQCKHRIAIANHHTSDGLHQYQYESDDFFDSTARSLAMYAALETVDLGDPDMYGADMVIDSDHVLQESTTQQMVFCPKQNQLWAWS